MAIFSEIFAMLAEVWSEMLSAFFAVLPKIFSFILLILVAILVLPCVFITVHLYPKWTDWGEKL